MTALTAKALTEADRIASALSDPAHAWAAASPDAGRRWPQSLAGGAAGIALLHIERAFAGRADWSTAHRWLQFAARDELTAAPNAGLYMGAPAVAFALRAPATELGTYRTAMTQLDTAVVNLTRRHLADAQSRIERRERPLLKEFDLIRGITGLGSYHLHRHPDHPITRSVLEYLTRLTEPMPKDSEQLPAWWTDTSTTGNPDPDAFPGGHGNFGMSHGIAAALALLSLSHLQGVTTPGSIEAIERICAWTDQWLQYDVDGAPWWPGFITRAQADSGCVDPRLRPRPSWCYGVAGTARAQQLAGRALADSARQKTAEDALLAAIRDPAQLATLPEIGLCHGLAGLLQSAWRMASDAQTPAIGVTLGAIVERLLAALPDSIPTPNCSTEQLAQPSPCTPTALVTSRRPPGTPSSYSPDRSTNVDDWHQINIALSPDAIEPTATAHLVPLLTELAAANKIESWFYLRKPPGCRLRYSAAHPVSLGRRSISALFRPHFRSPNSDDTAAWHLGECLDDLSDVGLIRHWNTAIYEPEQHAFGGAASMEIAHQFFYLDSHHAVSYFALGASPATSPGRREISILLISLMLRAARLDWYEQGDVWARVAEHRILPTDNSPSPEKARAYGQTLRSFMAADGAQLLTADGPLAPFTAWAAAYTETGRNLADLAEAGKLTRGLRSILAHHVIFAWNRLGLTAGTQAIIAHTAADVVFGRPQEPETIHHAAGAQT